MTKKYITLGIASMCIIAIAFMYVRSSTSTIRIGVLAPLSGTGATLGEWMKKGAIAAVDEINANNGINGKKLELVIEDDKCTGKDAVVAYQKLRSVDHLTYFAGPLCAAARIPVLKASEGDGSVLVTTGLAVTYGQNTTAKTYNVLPSVTLISKKILSYGFDSLHAKSISLLSIDDEFGKEVDFSFANEMKNRNISEYHIEKMQKGGSDFRSQIAKIAADDSDTILVAGFTPDYAVFMRQAHDMGFKKKILALSPIQAPDAAKANEGTGLTLYYPHPSATDSASAQAFLDSYQKKDPSASIMSPVYLGSGYDAVKIIALAIEKCGDNTECANKFIGGLSGYPGANGSITFGEKGNINSAESIEIRVLSDGRFSRVD